jgi:hypothetical protein
MEQCARLIDQVLRAVTVRNERDYELSDTLIAAVQDEVSDLCRRYAVTGYPETVPLP